MYTVSNLLANNDSGTNELEMRTVWWICTGMLASASFLQTFFQSLMTESLNDIISVDGMDL